MIFSLKPPPRWGQIVLAIMLALSIYMCVSCGDGFEAAPTKACKVIAELPHDPNNFTQGLLIADDGYLYEGTGQQGASRLIRVELKTGKVLKEAKLSAALFGEGIVIHDGMIYQLTWKNQKCIVFDQKNMIRRKQFTYRGEGWGITSNGKEFFMSNGSDEIVVRDPKDFKEIRRFTVTESTETIRELNELEFIEGELWANIWQQKRIARIDPATGKINSWVDCSDLFKKLDNEKPGVLNGIAYDAASKKIYVTGKNWGKLFEIKVD